MSLGFKPEDMDGQDTAEPAPLNEAEAAATRNLVDETKVLNELLSFFSVGTTPSAVTASKARPRANSRPAVSPPKQDHAKPVARLAAAGGRGAPVSSGDEWTEF